MIVHSNLIEIVRSNFEMALYSGKPVFEDEKWSVMFSEGFEFDYFVPKLLVGSDREVPILLDLANFVECIDQLVDRIVSVCSNDKLFLEKAI